MEVDGSSFAATARPVPDRDELFERIAEQYPFFAEHQRGTTRPIPVVELSTSA